MKAVSKEPVVGMEYRPIPFGQGIGRVERVKRGADGWREVLVSYAAGCLPVPPRGRPDAPESEWSTPVEKAWISRELWEEHAPVGDIVPASDHAGWERLRLAVRAARPAAQVPARDAWRTLQPDELWRRMVGQVAVIGSSRPWENARDSWAGGGITWPELDALPPSVSVDEVASRVQRFFATHGVRYAGRGEEASGKARGVARNFLRTRALGGPTAVLRAVSNVAAEEERIAFVDALLEQVANKGARDFLMDAGLVRESIAIDARVRRQLILAGLDEQAWIETSPYKVVEEAILSNVARPLGMEGVEVDRTMYQRADEIRAALARG